MRVCTDAVQSLKRRLKALEFPNLEDGSGLYGEATWNNAVEVVKAMLRDDGFTYRRENKTKVRSEGAAAVSHPLRAHLLRCCHGGMSRPLSWRYSP